MKELKLQVSSEIIDGIEIVWVTGDSTVIQLRIDVLKGILKGFSCRLEPGVVAEMSEVINAINGVSYPMLCVFTEDENHKISPQQFCCKRGNEWLIEY